MTVFLNMLVLVALINSKQENDSLYSPALVHKRNLKATTTGGRAILLDDDSYLGGEQQDQMDNGKQHILEIFQEAGVILTSDQIEALPTWSQVQEVVGTHPRILNLESCARYRDLVPPVERMLGPAGTFNTGTNLVTHLLKQNCEIPERREKCGPLKSKECYGMRWQVPWGKHTPAKFRNTHNADKAKGIRKDYVLPVVTMRDPYSWFHSMCKNGYAARWIHERGNNQHCPNLKNSNRPGNPWNPVHIHYGEDRDDNHASLAHLWNEWYGYYLNEADYPYVVVRVEDLVFYPKETIRQVCECAGGKIRTDQVFKYVVESAKADSPGHIKTTGIYQAWIKYSRPPALMGDFSEADFLGAKEALNQTLMSLMGYRHPPSASEDS